MSALVAQTIQGLKAIVFDIGDTLVHAAAPGTPVEALQVRPIGDAVAELTALSHHVKLGAVTDTSMMSSDDVRSAFGDSGLSELLETIVTSCDVGAAKPDPRGLLLALDRLGVDAEQTLFVGDADCDEGAAIAAGTWFARAGSGLSPGEAVKAFLVVIEAHHELARLFPSDAPPG